MLAFLIISLVFVGLIVYSLNWLDKRELESYTSQADDTNDPEEHDLEKLGMYPTGHD